MARRRIAYRKRRQNRFGMFLTGIVVLMLVVVVAVRSNDLKQKQDLYAEKEAALEKQIEEEKARSEEIEEYRKYTQTKKYVEEVAKDKLGLVYDGEIIFKEED
ncbi:MAG: septum formation initiator family protein [Lachnospiraceae bacterium]|nr:septum formation initiator family protein [Lachnospiraceae bacterium]